MRLPRCSMQAGKTAPVLIVRVMEAGEAYTAVFLAERS